MERQASRAGDGIKRRRLERGWSQRELARRAGVAWRTLKRVEEGGEVYDHVKAKIDRALDEDPPPGDERCLVCGHGVGSSAPMVQTRDGWHHRACAADYRRGVRWLKDLEVAG